MDLYFSPLACSMATRIALYEAGADANFLEIDPKTKQVLQDKSDFRNVNPLGLYDLDRNIRAVGRAYKKLISDWRDVLPAQSVCLVVPLVPPSRSEGAQARDQKADAIELLRHQEAQASSGELGP